MLPATAAVGSTRATPTFTVRILWSSLFEATVVRLPNSGQALLFVVLIIKYLCSLIYRIILVEGNIGSSSLEFAFPLSWSQYTM